MPHYIVLGDWTDQGIRNVKDSPKRAQDFKNAVEKSGGKVSEIYYTMGKHDFVAILEASNDETVMSVLLSLGSKGNVRTTTLKGFPISEAKKIVTYLS
jgi:uncharacterized protein with GYD domain